MNRSQPKKEPRHIAGRRGQRLARLLLALLILIGLTAAVIAFMPVKRCKLIGESPYDAEQLNAVLQRSEQSIRFFRLDKAALARSIHKALPYIHVTTIQRNSPGFLTLTVETLQPAFAQQAEAEGSADQAAPSWWLLSENGKLLELTATLPEHVMPLTGAPLVDPAPGSRASWRDAFTQPEHLLLLLEPLRSSTLWPSITGLQISTAALPDALYQDRIRIRFGTASPASSAADTSIEEKLQLAEQVIAQLETQNPDYRGIVDLSTPGQAFFTPDWAPAETPAVQQPPGDSLSEPEETSSESE